MTVVVEYADRREEPGETLWEIVEVHADVMYVRIDERGVLTNPRGERVFPDGRPETAKVYGEVRLE